MKTLLLFSAGIVAFAASALGGGTVNNLTQEDLEAGLVGGGTVLFAEGGTLTLSHTITITQDTILDGNGYAIIISGGNGVRLFQVTSNVAVLVKNITLADGRVVGADGPNGDPAPPGENAFGAGILNLGGAVTLTNCTLTHHYAQGGNAGQDLVNPSANQGRGGNAIGAAIYSLGGALNLTNCVVTGNAGSGGMGSSGSFGSLAYGDGGHALGGAIYSDGGTVNLDMVTLTNNYATGGAPGAVCTVSAGRGGNGSGGAIYLTNSVLSVSDSMLLSNTATGGIPSCNVYGGSGSGDGLGGALFLAPDSSAVVSQSLFSSNSATGGNGSTGLRYYPSGAGRGGAVFNAGALHVWASTFSGCGSAGGSQTRSAAAGQGGAIYSTNRLVIDSSTFVGNLAAGGNADGGGSSPTSPGAGEGGAVWSSGLVAGTNSTLTANRTIGGFDNAIGPPPPSGGPARGGGLFVSGGTALLVNATIAANRADGGTNPYYPAPPGPAQGGGLCNTNGSVTVRNSIIADSASGGDVSGTLSDAGYNICSDGTANFSAVGSLNQAEPLLGSLSHNGGPTATMSLLAGSPARDAIPSGFPPSDQRGLSRPQGPAADIGAFETATNNAAAIPPALKAQKSGQTLTVSFTAEAGRTYRLLSSTDLVSWVSVGTNSAVEAGVLQFVETINPGRHTFYRVATP